MGQEIQKLKPEKLWGFFYDLTQIPRPSSHEEEVINYVRDFAEKKGLSYEIDQVGNILVRKPAAEGKENVKGVVLQSHVDMVPQKNNSKVHDFTKDKIETVIDGEWLKANETTLGADNGIGVAAMLAVLDSNDIQHGPVEALFTINEEAGMEGAFGLKPKWLKGQILLNLDSEDMGELFVGCAGGINFEVSTRYKEKLTPLGISHEIVISGLKGGHSGLDINLGRANANKILGRILWSLNMNFQIELATVAGGDLRNAIPREAHARVIIPEKSESDFRSFFNDLANKIIDEYKLADPEMRIDLNPSGAPEMVISNSDASRLINMLNASRHGVVRLSDDMPGLVETSLNLAIVRFQDGMAEMKYLLRSAVDSAKYALADELTALHQAFGCSIESDGDYPGWKPNKSSYILGLMKEVYQNKFGETAAVNAIHAGLECGIIGGSYPDLDMVSFGPTIRFPHSPDEKVEISSVIKFWEYLKYTLEGIS